MTSTPATQPSITQPVTLANAFARLELLSQSHCADLQAAVGDLHTLWYTWVPTPAKMAAEIDRRLGLYAKGVMLPFAAIDPATGKAMGMTTFMNVDSVQQRLEIGSTWTGVAMQRSAFNTACKHLLLQHAFETLGCIAVEFRTHRMNTQSRRSIERIGAQLDGVLRSHMKLPNPAGGAPLIRDTAVYSITAAEWPAVETLLRHKLQHVSKSTV